MIPTVEERAARFHFSWRTVQPRPTLDCEIRRVPHATWRLFAPFHYLTPELHRSAACYALFIEGRPVSFVGILHRPHATRTNLKGISRLVTLPDWQGLGLAFALADRVAAAYTAQGWGMNMYPAHPALVRSYDRSPVWELRKAPGVVGTMTGSRSLQHASGWRQGARPNAVFAYRGPAMPLADARELVQVGAPKQAAQGRAGVRSKPKRPTGVHGPRRAGR